ncbi:MAG: tRNA (N6-isopentenyl adenosine(37)-C2)-methylthiotransferase MiaB [Selenomonadaceae bacterium]|nr:tRNA (N6-isopentenyl adenosine(37)-C2)-methylthiotransferase MiaB [Selenomonadaceae bacterium]
MNKKMKILTYGCQMNVADSERMAGQLQTIGYDYVDEFDEADLILINTCCVRESAEDRVYGKIGELKHLKRQNPKLIIGITGCMAQKEGEQLIRRAPHVDFVLGTGRTGELIRIVQSLEEVPSHIVDTSDVNGSESFSQYSAFSPAQKVFSEFVPIMYGCNNYCTYCIVPYVRGRERSRLPDDIINEVKEAVKAGVVEVILLGQNVNSYGKDHKLANFAELITEVDKIEGLRRLRFMTSHPKDLSDELIEAIRNGEHICEHIHLPVQYGSDRILKNMNRVYTVDQYRQLVKRIREQIPDVSLTTDLIVGFPGETDRDFNETLDFIREIKFDAAYTFIYSKRSGTPAAKFDNQVDDSIKHERLTRLMDVQNEISLAINEQLSEQVFEVLVEGASKTDPTIFTGRTRTNKLVLFKHDNEQVGDFINVKITQPQTWLLKGERVY